MEGEPRAFASVFAARETPRDGDGIAHIDELCSPPRYGAPCAAICSGLGEPSVTGGTIGPAVGLLERLEVARL